jgi:hypothetical protein
MWAAITPYALEYDRLLLYGVAALTNVRVGSREHWVSASVAGSLIGYDSDASPVMPGANRPIQKERASRSVLTWWA